MGLMVVVLVNLDFVFDCNTWGLLPRPWNDAQISMIAIRVCTRQANCVVEGCSERVCVCVYMWSMEEHDLWRSAEIEVYPALFSIVPCFVLIFKTHGLGTFLPSSV